MATLKTIPLSSIFVGERTRPVDEDHAVAIAASFVDRGLINPITVRPTPAANGGETPYTLVAGGHRLRAAELNKWPEIDALVVSTDAVEAQMMEIAENLYRNELTALDRGVFVVRYRELYEEKHGKIDPKGGRPKKQSNDWTDIFAPGKELSERVQERLGIGRATYFNVTKIGLKLTPALRNALRGTDAERDQKLLLKLAGMPETEQAALLGALKVEPDVRKALDAMKPAAAPVDPQAKLLKTLLASWKSASPETRGQFFSEIGIDPLDVPEVLEQARDAA